jgi:hypothetical protein
VRWQLVIGGQNTPPFCHNRIEVILVCELLGYDMYKLPPGILKRVKLETFPTSKRYDCIQILLNEPSKR